MSASTASAVTDRREAILDVAERLIRTKGYERMSIQAIQDELGISRGAVYHYFGSKEDVLVAVIERTSDLIMAALEPVLTDPDAGADAKLQRIFEVAGRWKTQRRELIRQLVDVWMSDDNAVARVKLRRVSLRRLQPVLVDILEQGNSQGVFHVASPRHTARVLVDLLEGTGEAAAELLVGREDAAVALAEVRRVFAAYDQAVERVLGTPPGSFTCIDEQTLRAWFA
jgi:AcrR family transcriptional regulator